MNDTKTDNLLSAHEIRKVYDSSGGKVEVLKGVSLEVRSGEIVSIIGASGVGKSTLLNIIGTLDRPTSGELIINEKDVFSMSDSELSRFRNVSIGFIFQFHHLLPEFTALENVMLPALLSGNSKEAVMDKASLLLADVGLSNRETHKPSELSGGERQRVAVARALMNDPELVLADEPSGNLDRDNAEALYELIWKMRDEKKQTFIIVTHNEELAEKADRIIRLEDGIVKN
ncbi:MAG: ABC transporter ATP-binding protein [Candidatus Marinimicrobia bacterium]|nr:ABC transporter ATP-binding protein [Candidatus Neomarinimicrobiota bacterium]